MLIFSWILDICCFIGLSIFIIIWANKNKGKDYKKAILGSILYTLGGIIFRLSSIILSFPPNDLYRILAPAGIMFIFAGMLLVFKYYWTLRKLKIDMKS
jgi:hypothetical protein